MTHEINLPEPSGYIYVWDGPYGTRKFTMAPHNGSQCDRAVPYYTAEQLRAAVFADREGRWLDIESAPTDGTPLLLFGRLITATASTRVVGAFVEGEWLSQHYTGQSKAVLVPSHYQLLPDFPPYDAQRAKEPKDD